MTGLLFSDGLFLGAFTTTLLVLRHHMAEPPK
jgi:hypothetical protein